MASLVSAASACHTLQLPPTEKDDRLNLNVRTGSAATLYKSFVFTFGGLTIGLELETMTIPEIIEVFLSRLNNHKSKRLSGYLSGEVFYLHLVERTWTRVKIPERQPRPKPRLWHEVCAINNSVYVFGGLVIRDDFLNREVTFGSDPYEVLEPCNDLWELNLETKKWTLLHDGKGFETSPMIPSPRYFFKMTPLHRLTLVKKTDHFGLIIAGGNDWRGKPIYENAIFDLVDKQYVGDSSFYLEATTGKYSNDSKLGLDKVAKTNEEGRMNISYGSNVILNFNEEVTRRGSNGETSQKVQEQVIVYCPMTDDKNSETDNPLLSFKMGKTIKQGRQLFLARNADSKDYDKKKTTQIVPFNLRYPTGGLFGQNIVITGFLQNDFDISIFIYNKPTGKWSRLNIFCIHDYGSHRFWGGYTWQSHHKVVLIGNYLTSRTTSSIRYFTIMITVSLPITNILVSSEIALGDKKKNKNPAENFLKSDDNLDRSMKDTDDDKSTSTDFDSNVDNAEDSDDEDNSSIESERSEKEFFNDYVHYAAPNTNFTTVRSIFPPSAITLGRNAFDRYGDFISDFELISANGDRIPISLSVLLERWGRYFISVLTRCYVKAVDSFQSQQDEDFAVQLNPSKHSSTSSGNSKLNLKSSIGTMSGSSVSSDSDQGKDFSNLQFSHSSNTLHTSQNKDMPHFRLPFQDHSSSGPEKLNSMEGEDPTTFERPSCISSASAVDPHQTLAFNRKDSISSFSSGSSLLNTHIQDIPPQLPLPSEPIPPPSTSLSFRNGSRKNSGDHNSPRSSLVHTLTVLRKIPLSKSPRESPYSSPRASVSLQTDGGEIVDNSNEGVNLKSQLSKRRKSQESTPSDSGDSISSVQVADNKVSKRSSNTSVTSSDSHETERSRRSSVQFADYEDKGAGDCNNEKGIFSNSLLNFDDFESGKFKMEPTLTPRKLYVPFSTVSLKAFCEFLYTGQVGNRWLLNPTALDNLAMGKFYKVPLLYDLMSEILFGVIGRKEAYIIKMGNSIKKKYFRLVRLTKGERNPDIKFPLEEYEGFMHTVDDGYIDVALLKKISKFRRTNSVSSSVKKKSKSKGSEEDLETKKDKEDKEDKEDDSTDDSSSKKASDDDIDFELGYLEVGDKTNLEPRSKSVFDKRGQSFDFADDSKDENGNEDGDENDDEAGKSKNVTLDQLISPDSQIPSDYVIDLIYGACSIVGDLKLMLRAENVRHMTKILKVTEAEVGKEIERLEKLYEEQGGNTSQEGESRQPEPTGGELSDKGFQPSVMSRQVSSASFSSLDLDSKTGNRLEKTKSTNSYRAGLGSLAPFKLTPIDSKKPGEQDTLLGRFRKKEDRVKPLDSRINTSTDKLVPPEDAPSQKAPHRLTRSSTGASASSTKSHSIFHLSRKKKSPTAPNLNEHDDFSRTKSSAESVYSDTSKNSDRAKKKHGLFGRKR